MFDTSLANACELNNELRCFIASVDSAHAASSFDPSAVPDPKNICDAFARPDAAQWRMFVFKRKTLSDGSLDKYKARFVIRGNTQVKGVDFTDTFAPTLRVCSLRYIAQLAIDHSWSTRCGDVPGAYLNPKQPNTVYLEQIPGFASQPPGTEPIADPALRRQMYVLQVLTGLYGGANSGNLCIRS